MNVLVIDVMVKAAIMALMAVITIMAILCNVCDECNELHGFLDLSERHGLDTLHRR